jgi:cyclopropane fatty-acyl-phospholipid synthase-like methyltransferase
MTKPCSQACINNRDPILRVIEPLLKDYARVLEIGSGTGQHAIYFANRMRHLTWIVSDLPANHPGISAWLSDVDSPNIQGPLSLDVHSPQWQVGAVDAVFSANTAHIMDTSAVQAMFTGTGRILSDGGLFLLYGPFCRGGQQTSDSNLRFDRFLRAQDPSMGIRDLDWLTMVAAEASLGLQEEVAMPANNMTLIWRKLVSANLPVDGLAISR